ncbi:hypothetical protein J7E90_30045 [Streptomyces sp. ISL-111]|uniref:hypothetical protein n=1 Tax=unclassified Streptomyces TaxID=2593676 RepID=UPI001BE7587B|nr:MULTISPECIES: hypothetical protein [unclassified Streptomyces]MBT2381425.1 hypothetical protein [Streptomyces sp. ISL-111]MBT2424336.1 hypothetical protein [Streptomyces sp. ISL-112]MBT2463656.1 hypothetical protein [Streptomyces sp. ISL-63]
MRTSSRTTPVEAQRQRGFRFEVLRYGPATRLRARPVDLRILANPRDAIRVLRVQLHASHVLGLAAGDGPGPLLGRAGWLGAGLGALHRGEEAGSP